MAGWGAAYLPACWAFTYLCAPNDDNNDDIVVVVSAVDSGGVWGWSVVSGDGGWVTYLGLPLSFLLSFLSPFPPLPLLFSSLLLSLLF